MSWELYETGAGFIKATVGDFKDCSDYFQKFILQRIKKVRKDKWPLPQRWKAVILQNMEVLYLFFEAEDKKNNVGRKEPKKLIWKDTGQKFAAFVAPAIQNGLIELEGNESQGPLLERLTQYIRIEKVKGSGGLGQESLVTYLKQAIRED